jgi:hypothetical protein
MKVRHGLAALVVAGGVVIGNVGMATAAAPTPTGCTVVGKAVVQCVKTSTASTVYGPFSTGGFVSAGATFGPFTGVQLCAFALGFQNAGTILLDDASVHATVTTTTTTVRRGVDGPVLSTSRTISSPPLASVTYALLGCGIT